jgi:hypothetical protein
MASSWISVTSFHPHPEPSPLKGEGVLWPLLPGRGVLEPLFEGNGLYLTLLRWREFKISRNKLM